jgi:hypothetical protein
MWWFTRTPMLFLSAQNAGKEVCMEVVCHMISKNVVASDKCMGLDDPITCENFTRLLHKVMQEDSCTWDAIQFMDK